MSEKDGTLSKADQDKIVSHLNEKGKNHTCPVCLKNNWGIGDRLLNGMPISPDAALHIGGPSYPMAFVVCNNCSYVRHFMAVPLGLFPGDELSKPKDPSDG